MSGLTSLAALVGAGQLVTGTFTPPVSDLAVLGLDSWVLPGVWLAASVAVPCAVVTALVWRRPARAGVAAVVAAALLLVELGVQVPVVGLDPLQAVMTAVAGLLALLGTRLSRQLARGGAPVGVARSD